MRQFALINEYGQRYALNDVRTGFLEAPKGLGFSMESSYTKVGSRWVQNYFRDNQPVVSGTVVFHNKPYDAFKEFILFARTAKTLKLEYTTTAGTYIRDVHFSSCTKTEISEGKVLKCDISLTALSLWYSNSQYNFVVKAWSSNDEMRYNFRYPSRYHDYSNGIVQIVNDGSVSAPFTMTIYGAITSPVITLIENGVVTAELNLSGVTININEAIHFSSVDGNLYCYKEADGIITNLVPYLDIDKYAFFKFPVGQSQLKIEAASAIVNPITLEVQRYYRAV